MTAMTGFRAPLAMLLAAALFFAAPARSAAGPLEEGRAIIRAFYDSRNPAYYGRSLEVSLSDERLAVLERSAGSKESLEAGIASVIQADIFDPLLARLNAITPGSTMNGSVGIAPGSPSLAAPLAEGLKAGGWTLAGGFAAVAAYGAVNPGMWTTVCAMVAGQSVALAGAKIALTPEACTAVAGLSLVVGGGVAYWWYRDTIAQERAALRERIARSVEALEPAIVGKFEQALIRHATLTASIRRLSGTFHALFARMTAALRACADAIDPLRSLTM